MKRFLAAFSGISLIGISLIGIGFWAGVVSAPAFSPINQPPIAAIQPSPTTVPSQALSEAEMQMAADRARFLTTRYSVAETEVAALTKASYDVATMIGLKTTADRTQMHQVTLDFAEHGGAGLHTFGIEGDDLSVAKQLGGTSVAQLKAVTPSQIVRTRALMATVGLLKYELGR